MILGDNDPYYVHANLVLQDLVGCKLMGNNYGAKTLQFGDSKDAGKFNESHIIFAGINQLYEGITICYPDNKTSKLKTLATGSDGQPCILNCESGESNFPGGGRIVVDSGWTKMYQTYWASAGQSRYVVNACVWLVDVEKKFGVNIDELTNKVERT